MARLTWLATAQIIFIGLVLPEMLLTALMGLVGLVVLIGVGILLTRLDLRDRLRRITEK
jgi:hypothetical protein